MSTEERVPVLIIGGGPTGLMLSILLGRAGIESLLVDRDAGPTDHPQAHVVNIRSMELFRLLGLDEQIYAEALPPEAGGHVRIVASMTGHEFADLDIAPSPERIGTLMAATPSRPASCAQDRLEPILAELARKDGGRIEFATELVSLDARPDGAVATLRRADGERVVRADWVVGCDGAGSTTRREVGIAMEGPEALARVVGIYFVADLAKINEERPSVLFWTLDAEVPGTFICMDGRERFVFHAPWMDEDVPFESFDEARCKAILERAIGFDADPEIKSVAPWVMTAQIAERYREGRVLLAGDAAHRFPPTGGFGMNTGLQDAHNLAWKLAAVLDGRAPESLLDTYGEERKPIAQGNSEWSVRNALNFAPIIGPGAVHQATRLANGEISLEALSKEIQTLVDGEKAHFAAFGRDLGFHYESGALVQDGTALPERPDEDLDLAPNARPGSRAPHFGLIQGEALRSSLDFFDGVFTLLATRERAAAWRAAADAQSQSIEVLIVGEDAADPADVFPTLYGISTGAVLVRPDGHVGWRTAALPSDPDAALGDALRRILGDA
ncbi:MAG: FAD-dependent monooxygenase [Myxococcota bacterium]